MVSHRWVLRLLLGIFFASMPLSIHADSLEAGFLQPPHNAKPSVYWIWLNDYVNREHIDRELRLFAEHGIGGVLIFDMGTRGDPRFVPPAGPAFMSPQSVDNIAYATKKAKQYGLDLQLAACSSWDMGGSWVTPEQASMALYRTEMHTQGPSQLDALFPYPKLPARVPRTKAGQPIFSKEIALLAVPETIRLPGHEFIFRLPGKEPSQIDHVVLYNTTSENPKKYGKHQLFAKDFSVAVSTGEPVDADFREVVVEALEPHDKAQQFDFQATSARYLRLRVINGHNKNFDRIQLGEFEVYSTEGFNVVGSHAAQRARDPAELISASSQEAVGKSWTAANLHDGVKSGRSGSWAASGPPPLVIENPSHIINLSGQLDAEGRLCWDVPEGNWTLMRFVCANTGERLKVPSPNSDGLATDHFSAEATRDFITTLLGRLETKLGDLSNSGIKQLYLPSYEVRGLIWTPEFLEQFKKYRGYDMTTYLPALVGCRIENEDRTRRFQYDFQKTRGDLLVDAFYREASKTVHEKGLGIEAEAGGPGPPVHHVPVDALRALGAVDEMRGEFWPWRPDMSQLWVVKETACAAHIYGRRRVHMESFTGFRHWQDGPNELKPSADRAFCEGMNHIVWHTSTHQPEEAGKPGWVYGAGSHLTPNLAWWPLAKPFLDYLSRCSFMLQQGKFIGDVCYYYGDQGANFVPPKHTDPSLGLGYDYDVTNAEVILTRMSVQDGLITLPDGMHYELLVLPERDDFDLKVLQKIEQLLQAGATVVGPKPVRSNGLTDYPNRDRQVQQLADQIWGDCDGKNIFERPYGKGKIVWGRSLRAILQQKGVGPDFEFISEQHDLPTSDIDYIHRKTPDTDIYFLRNKTSKPITGVALFRVANKIPEFWHPDSAQRIESALYEQVDGATRVPISLGSNGSVFVVFRKSAEPFHVTSIKPPVVLWKAGDHDICFASATGGEYTFRLSNEQTLEVALDPLPKPIDLKSEWTVHFPTGWGAPKSTSFEKLISWTSNEIEGIRHFSGVARYETTMEVPGTWLEENRRVTIDLGNLWALGRVRVNGERVGTLWKPPYQLDITDVVHSGKNRLEVEIANTWANRLVGDASLPEEKRFCRTNINTTGAPEAPGVPWGNVPLHPSGLFGPVRILPSIEKTITLRK